MSESVLLFQNEARVDMLYSWIGRIWYRLYRHQLPVDLSRKGHIGSVPYLSFLRFLVYGGAFLRFSFHKAQYSPQAWVLIIVALFTALLFATVEAFLSLRKEGDRTELQRFMVGADIVFISLLYYMTHVAESDFFLFYYLPILSTAEYLGTGEFRRTSVLVSAAFLAVLLLIHAMNYVERSMVATLVTIFLPREVFFVVIAVIGSFLRQYAFEQSQHKKQIETILSYRSLVDNTMDVESILRSAIQTSVEVIGGKTGFVWLHEGPGRAIRCESDTTTVTDGLISDVVGRMGHTGRGEVVAVPRFTALCTPLIAHANILGTLCILTESTSTSWAKERTSLKSLAEPIGLLIEGLKFQDALSEIVRISSRTSILDRELDDVLNEVVNLLGFDYGAILLVDDYMQRIEIIRSLNVPPRWVRTITSNPVLTDIIQDHAYRTFDAGGNRHSLAGQGGMSSYDDHAKIVAPILTENSDGTSSVVGMIEAGCVRKKESVVLTPANVNALVALGATHGASIGENRTPSLLASAADRAIHIIGAEFVSIHVYRDSEMLFQAGAGLATPEFLSRFSEPRPGRGEQIGHGDRESLRVRQ